ncbi:MAG: TetR/AcrR family transcriptional regulator [Solirubrobacterales bacterium]
MQATSPDPLPRGRHGLKPAEVAAHQRGRIADGIARAVAEHGYGSLTVERVIELAGVSRSTFYAHFDNKLEAVLASHELIFERFMVEIVDSCGRDEWPAKIRDAVGATLTFASTAPAQFQMLSVGSLAVDVELAGRILDSFQRLAGLLAGVRAVSPYRTQLPSCTEQFLVGGLAATVSSWLSYGQQPDLSELQRQLVELTLIPYYGRAKAARLSRVDG